MFYVMFTLNGPTRAHTNPVREILEEARRRVSNNGYATRAEAVAAKRKALCAAIYGHPAGHMADAWASVGASIVVAGTLRRSERTPCIKPFVGDDDSSEAAHQPSAGVTTLSPTALTNQNADDMAALATRLANELVK